MKTAEYQEIIINWSNRQTIKTIDDLAKCTDDRHNVLYQLYGDHHIYGRDTLLYIGKSVYADNRMRAHLNGIFSFVNNLSVSIGKIDNYDESLEIPESILIACQLYIGKSVYADNRMRAHLNGIFSFVNNLSVSIGKIDNYDESLEIPESILIACHKPSYNKEFIHDLSPKAKQHKIIVINNGNNEMLKTCCTNFWWVD